MTEIESRIESIREEPDYAGKEFTSDLREQGTHRSFVGGMWEEMGDRQLAFLVEQGLRPDHLFLDVGCGSLRGGRKLVDYLEPDHYYGIDVNKSLIEAGYDDELTDEQRTRLPSSHLRHTDRFDADFGVSFDVAIAQSVFTHISLNNARLCLHRVAKVMAPGSRFFVTFFEGRPTLPVDGIPKGTTQFSERNPYWYYRRDLRYITRGLPWEMNYIGNWGHPKHQRMIEYVRIEDIVPPPPRPRLPASASRPG